jgi:hypothetical protein
MMGWPCLKSCLKQHKSALPATWRNVLANMVCTWGAVAICGIHILAKEACLMWCGVYIAQHSGQDKPHAWMLQLQPTPACAADCRSKQFHSARCGCHNVAVVVVATALGKEPTQFAAAANWCDGSTSGCHLTMMPVGT